MNDEMQKTVSSLAEKCFAKLNDINAKHGFFPSSHQLFLRSEKSFTFKRRLRVYRTTPHLRLELILSFVLNCFFFFRSGRNDDAKRIPPNPILGGDANSFYFNGLILELLEMIRGTCAPGPREAIWEQSMVQEFVSDTLAYPLQGKSIPTWGYFPIKHPRFGSKLFLKLMFEWGALAEDFDSTSMVLCRLFKNGDESIQGRAANAIADSVAMRATPDAEAVLALMESHVHRMGAFGKNELAYDNGALPEDAGVLLWIQEKHNELDAGVNINLLCLLGEMLKHLDEHGRARACKVSAGIFDFLDRHIRLGGYASPSFLMFYSIEVMSFLWYRLAWYVDAMDGAERDDFDPKDACDRLGKHLRDLVEARIAANAGALNDFEILMSLPMLLRARSPFASSLLARRNMDALIETVSENAFAFGKFIYPFRFLYGNRAVGLCAALLALKELEARE